MRPTVTRVTTGGEACSFLFVLFRAIPSPWGCDGHVRISSEFASVAEQSASKLRGDRSEPSSGGARSRPLHHELRDDRAGVMTARCGLNHSSAEFVSSP